MKRQAYYPSRIADQIPWLENFRTKVGAIALALGLPTAKTDAAIASARFAVYVLSQWLPAVRTFGPAATAALDDVLSGTGGSAVVLPTFTAPALPAGVAPVPPGALNLIFDLVEEIKTADGFLDTMGEDLNIIGAAAANTQNAPKITLEVLQGTPCQCVKISFVKYGHMGVYIECRRNGGAWEFVSIDTETPYSDERALLVPTAPEIREYRARFWDKGTPNGDWCDVAKVTVAP